MLAVNNLFLLPAKNRNCLLFSSNSRHSRLFITLPIISFQKKISKVCIYTGKKELGGKLHLLFCLSFIENWQLLTYFANIQYRVLPTYFEAASYAPIMKQFLETFSMNQVLFQFSFEVHTIIHLRLLFTGIRDFKKLFWNFSKELSWGFFSRKRW